MLARAGHLYWGPVDSDLVNQFYPWHTFIHRWITRGVIPWWDPHVFSGYPTLETQQMLALNPVHLISLVLPAHHGLPLQMCLHTIIASAGMAWGLHKWGRVTPMAAAVGACVWAFGALFAVRVTAGHFTVVAALAWWPLAALSLLRLGRLMAARTDQPTIPDIRKSRLLRFIVSFVPTRVLAQPGLVRLALVVTFSRAMVLLAGGPQYVVYLFYIDMAIMLSCARRGSLRQLLGTAGCCWVAAVLLTAPQWLPAMWYLPYSARATGGGGAKGLDLGPLRNLWLEALLPYPFGDDLSAGHLHFKNVWETATYPGVFALVCSLAGLVASALWAIRNYVPLRAARSMRVAASPLMLAGSVVFIAGLYMTIGGWLPGFGGFREATKGRAVCAFAAALLAASGFDYVVRRPARVKYALWAGCTVVFASIISAFKYEDHKQFLDLLKSFGPPMDPNAGRAYAAALEYPDMAVADYSVALVWSSMVLFLVIFAAGCLKKFPRFAAVLLLVCATADPVLSHSRNWVARNQWDAVGLPKAVEQFFAPKLNVAEQAGELPWRVILHSGVINRTHHLDGLYEFHGYDPLMPARGVNRLLVMGSAALTDADRSSARTQIVGAAGIRFDTRNWWPAANDASGTTVPLASEIIEATTASLFEITRRVTAGSPDEGVFGPSVQGMHYALSAKIKGNAQIAAMGQRDSATNDITDTIGHVPSNRPDEWSVRVSLSSPALVVFKSTWLPGWRVFLNGEEDGPALLVNGWMCGAIVPAGTHDVVFRYRPMGLFWAVTLSAGTGALLIMGLILRKSKVFH